MKGDVIYGRSLCEIEVKELRVAEIIHLGPLVNKKQTRAEAGRSAQGSWHPWVGRAFRGHAPSPEGFCCRIVKQAGEKQDALRHQQRTVFWHV